jgi:hypothetical protein
MPYLNAMYIMFYPYRFALHCTFDKAIAVQMCAFDPRRILFFGRMNPPPTPHMQ